MFSISQKITTVVSGAQSGPVDNSSNRAATSTIAMRSLTSGSSFSHQLYQALFGQSPSGNQFTAGMPTASIEEHSQVTEGRIAVLKQKLAEMSHYLYGNETQITRTLALYNQHGQGTGLRRDYQNAANQTFFQNTNELVDVPGDGNCGYYSIFALIHANRNKNEIFRRLFTRLETKNITDQVLTFKLPSGGGFFGFWSTTLSVNLRDLIELAKQIVNEDINQYRDQFLSRNNAFIFTLLIRGLLDYAYHQDQSLLIDPLLNGDQKSNSREAILEWGSWLDYDVKNDIDALFNHELNIGIVETVSCPSIFILCEEMGQNRQTVLSGYLVNTGIHWQAAIARTSNGKMLY